MNDDEDLPRQLLPFYVSVLVDVLVRLGTCWHGFFFAAVDTQLKPCMWGIAKLKYSALQCIAALQNSAFSVQQHWLTYSGTGRRSYSGMSFHVCFFLFPLSQPSGVCWAWEASGETLKATHRSYTDLGGGWRALHNKTSCIKMAAEGWEPRMSPHLDNAYHRTPTASLNPIRYLLAAVSKSLSSPSRCKQLG